MPDLMHWPSPGALRRLTGLALLATLVLEAFFAVHDRGLSPYSIVAYELAWTPAQAARLFAAWGAAGARVARESLWIDFAFMPAYALLFAGLVLTEARDVTAGLRRVGLRIVLAPLAAWLFDALENASLLGVLGDTAAPSAPLLLAAGLAASLKFLLLLACIVYILTALAYRVARRRI